MRKRPRDFFEEHIRGIYIRDRKIGRGSGRRQAFVKITGRSYTSQAVVASLRYIGKESDGVGKDTRVIDESGKEIKPADFEKAVKEWNFNPEIDRRNESKGTRERKTRLTTQFVVSFPKSCSLSVKQTEDFMDAFMLPYREKGAKYFTAVHTEQRCKHAHVIVRNKTEFGERLTFDRKDIQALRQKQVDVAKSYGIRLENTLVRQRREEDRPIKKTLLERQVPEWHAKNAEIVLRDKGPRPIPFLQRLPELEHKPEALDVWAQRFKDGNKATVLFLEMYAENPRTAFWYANNKPDVFGKRKVPNAPTELLNSQTFRLTPKDRENILKSRDEIAACMTSPLAYPRIGIEAAWRKIHNLTAEHKHSRQTKEREREIEI
mgnify:CR=1 FL=1